ncbi:MAG: hypothetical protein E7627_02355 [Ruminococcaceae bacterium]|nr:hypothetical protein [Oscillospiraceae bacterium]
MLYIIFTVLSVALTTVLAFLPFENLFINFDSPKEAYEYYTFSKSNIELVVEGNECDFVVDCKNNVDTHLIIPKTADGWKVGIGSNTKRIVYKHSNGITVYVYQYSNTSEYFITILDTNGGVAIVSDNYGTEFYSLEKDNDSLNTTFVTYYAYIPDFNLEYSVIVNGNEIVLKTE